MNKNQIIEEVAKCIGCNSEELGEESGLGLTPGWDSLAHVEILERLEGVSGKKLSVDESIFSETLGDLIALFEG